MTEDQNDSGFKGKIPRINREKIQARARLVKAWVRKFAITIGMGAMLIAGFVIGARMHELGALAGVFGKSLKGATVTISGNCLVNSEPRNPALAEDEVIVTSVDDTTLFGVVRKTREKIECKKSDIAIETLPLLSSFTKTPVAVPEITMGEVRNKIPSYKLLENKILLASGTCRSQLDNKEIPSFTDERLDVTSVEASKDNPEVFFINAIRRSDKLAVSCSSKSIRYTITDGSEPITRETPKVPVTFVGKTVYVTSKCVPDPAVRRPKGKDGRNVLFYRLVNIEVQVLQEELSNDKLMAFRGSIVDPKSEGFGQSIVCNQKDFPFTAVLKEKDDEVMLERPDSQQNRPNSKGNSQLETDDEAAVSAGKKSKVVPPAKTDETMQQDMEKEKADLLKQLDGGVDGK
jgi:hypothetical protein